MSGDDLVGRFMLSIAVLLMVAAGGGGIAGRVGQPAVIGEVLGGILLGPAILGGAAPGVRDYLLPVEVLPLVTAAATLGLAVFMFRVGIEVSQGAVGAAVGERPRTMLVLNVANFGLPFVVGLALGSILYRPFGTAVAYSAFVLFIGVAFAVSALPVLARILEDRAMLSTRLGRLAIGAAATGDIAAWSILGVATGLARQSPAGLALWPIAVAAVGVLFVSSGSAGSSRDRTPSEGHSSGRPTVVITLAAIVLATFVTETAGIGLIFGPFVLGIAVSRAFWRLTESAADLRVVSTVLMPLYFVETGARMDLRILADPGLLTAGLLLIVVAVSSKVGASLLAARVSGLGLVDGLSLGLMLNTRGLTELVVLNVGMSAGILSTGLFTLFVLIALVTTALTGPALDLLASRRPLPVSGVAAAAGPDEGA